MNQCDLQRANAERMRSDVAALVSSHPQGMMIGEVVAHFNQPRKRVLHYMQSLRDAGVLVIVGRSHKQRWASPEHVESAQEFVAKRARALKNANDRKSRARKANSLPDDVIRQRVINAIDAKPIKTTAARSVFEWAKCA